MQAKDIKELKIESELFCCPKEYQGLPDISDDYDITAMLMAVKKPNVIAKALKAIDCEEDYRYGPSSGYKGRYSYNRDD